MSTGLSRGIVAGWHTLRSWGLNKQQGSKEHSAEGTCSFHVSVILTHKNTKFILNLLLLMSLLHVPIEGSSLFGFFQLKVTILPVIDSITGVPSGGSGRISESGNNQCQMSKQQLVSAAIK